MTRLCKQETKKKKCNFTPHHIPSIFYLHFHLCAHTCQQKQPRAQERVLRLYEHKYCLDRWTEIKTKHILKFLSGAAVRDLFLFLSMFRSLSNSQYKQRVQVPSSNQECYPVAIHHSFCKHMNVPAVKENLTSHRHRIHPSIPSIQLFMDSPSNHPSIHPSI